MNLLTFKIGMLKKLTVGIIISFVFVSGFLMAQDDYKATHEGWYVDLNKAYEESVETGKPIMANFTGSDWCGWCKKLSAAVFVKDDFKSWANENVVLLELDFPRRTAIPNDIKRQNQNLRNAFKVGGFPTVWVFYMSKEEGQEQFNIQALGKTGYKSNVNAFTSDVDEMIERAKGS
jgi:protein disulfide-isomerase